MIPTWSPIELSLDDEYIQEPILITPRSKAFNIKSKQNEVYTVAIIFTAH